MNYFFDKLLLLPTATVRQNTIVLHMSNTSRIMHRLYNSACQSPTPVHEQDPIEASFYHHCIVVSKIASSSGLRLCALTVFCIFLHRLVLTPTTLGSLYGQRYSCLSQRYKQRIRFIHVGLVIKSIILIVISPTLLVVLCLNGSNAWSTPFTRLSSLAPFDLFGLGPVLLSALYLFELILDDNMGLLGALHHISALLAMQGFFVWIMWFPAHDQASFETLKSATLIASLWSKLASLYSKPKRHDSAGS